MATWRPARSVHFIRKRCVAVKFSQDAALAPGILWIVHTMRLGRKDMTRECPVCPFDEGDQNQDAERIDF